MVLTDTSAFSSFDDALFVLSDFSVVASITGRSYVSCFGLTVPASDAVHRVCFGVLVIPPFVLILAVLWQVP